MGNLNDIIKLTGESKPAMLLGKNLRRHVLTLAAYALSKSGGVLKDTIYHHVEYPSNSDGAACVFYLMYKYNRKMTLNMFGMSGIDADTIRITQLYSHISWYCIHTEKHMYVQIDSLTYALIKINRTKKGRCSIAIDVFGLNIDKFFNRLESMNDWFNSLSAPRRCACQNIETMQFVTVKKMDDLKTNGIANKKHVTGRVTYKSFDNLVFDGKDQFLKKLNGCWRNSIQISKWGASSSIGILLSGTPGTGKTSIAKAIAAKTNRVLVNIKIGDMSIDDIISTMQSISYSTSVILFDDCDVLLTKRNEDMTFKYVDIMLQILDGAFFEYMSESTPPIVILTTNHKDKIDPAVIRAGRINIEWEVNNLDENLSRELCTVMNADPDIILKGCTFPCNPAWIQDKIISNLVETKGLSDDTDNEEDDISNNNIVSTYSSFRNTYQYQLLPASEDEDQDD